MAHLKWTIRLLQLFKTFQFIVAVLILVFSLFEQDHKVYLTLWSIFLFAFSFFSDWVQVNLQAKKTWAWNLSIVISGCSFFSIFLPLSYLSLKELFHETKREEFFKPKVKSEVHQLNYINLYDSLDYSPGIHSIWKGLFISLLVYFIVVISQFHSDVRSTHLRNSDVSKSINSSFKNNFDSESKYAHKNGLKDLSQLSLSQLENAGRKCNTEGDSACSKAVYQRILEIDPNHMSALCNLAVALTELGEHISALKLYLHYFKFGGQGDDIRFYFAKSLEATQQFEEALVVYLDLLHKNPKLIDVGQRSVSLLLKKGDKKSALQIVHDFEVLDPKSRTYFPVIAPETKDSSNLMNSDKQQITNI